MNDSTLMELKIIVERAVRPVTASMTRKRKIREELLAHVCAVSDEESARLGDEAAALKEVARRFGDPAELSKQLQNSVPSFDRLLRFQDLLFGLSRISMFERALLWTLVMTIFPTAVMLALYYTQDRMNEWPIALIAPVTVFFASFLMDHFRDAWLAPSGRNWRRFIVASAASCFLIPGAVFAVCLFFTGDLASSLLDSLPILLAGIPTPAVMFGLTGLVAKELRLQREWASLQID